jgi:hypothetical protein
VPNWVVEALAEAGIPLVLPARSGGSGGGGGSSSSSSQQQEATLPSGTEVTVAA